MQFSAAFLKLYGLLSSRMDATRQDWLERGKFRWETAIKMLEKIKYRACTKNPKKPFPLHHRRVKLCLYHQKALVWDPAKVSTLLNKFHGSSVRGNLKKIGQLFTYQPPGMYPSPTDSSHSSSVM